MTLSKERLEEKLNDCERYHHAHQAPINVKELREVILELLERLERDKQEPVAYIVQDKYERQNEQPGHLSLSHVSKYVSDEDINEHEITCTPLYAEPPATSYTEAMLRGAQAQMRCILGDLELPENTPFVEVLNAIDALKNPDPSAPVVQPVQVQDERASYEAFVEQRLGDCVDRRRAKNGDQEYMAWDMAMGWIVWQGRAAMLKGGKP